MILRRAQIIMVLTLFWMLAVVLPQVHFAPANWEGLKQRLMESPPSMETLLGIILALAAILFAGLVLFLWKGRRKKRKGDDSYELYREPIHPPWSLYGVFFLLLAAMAGILWWARQPSKVERATPPPHFTAPSEKESTKVPPEVSPQGFSGPKPPQFVWGGNLLAIGLLAGLGWVVWRLLKERPEGADQDTRKVGQIAAQAALDLERGAELSDVVLRCYRDMGNILRRKVVLRQEMTAREFAQRLQEVGVREEEVARLTALFEKVRYGRYGADPKERAEAIALLQAIEDQYGKVADET